jgi:hypothetical protein
VAPIIGAKSSYPSVSLRDVIAFISGNFLRMPNGCSADQAVTLRMLALEAYQERMFDFSPSIRRSSADLMIEKEKR